MAGLDDNKITGLTGSSGALPVWTNVMKQLRQQPVNLRQTDDVQNGNGLTLPQVIYPLRVAKVRCTSHSCVTMSRVRQTVCGLPHYQVEPTYNSDTEKR